MEAYNADLGEIMVEIKNMKDMVEETNQFINTHLDSVRNRMIRLGLFMEMGALSLGSGAVVAGGFGMNLTHGMEAHPTAFYLTCGGIGTLMGGVFGLCARRYIKLSADTSGAQSYKSLKNFFQYVDELDRIVETKGDQGFTKPEFKAVLNKVTGLKVTDEESEFIFKMFDTDRDGRLDREEMRLRKVKDRL